MVLRIGIEILKTNEFVLELMDFVRIFIIDDSKILVYLRWEFYIIDNLYINTLIDCDIFLLKDIQIYSTLGRVIIYNYEVGTHLNARRILILSSRIQCKIRIIISKSAWKK